MRNVKNEIKHVLVEFCSFLFPSYIINSKFKIKNCSKKTMKFGITSAMLLKKGLGYVPVYKKKNNQKLK